MEDLATVGDFVLDDGAWQGVASPVAGGTGSGEEVGPVGDLVPPLEILMLKHQLVHSGQLYENWHYWHYCSAAPRTLGRIGCHKESLA